MSSKPQYTLSEVDGDLFSAPKTYSLAHCVGADLAMGAGIAVQFKKVFGRLDELQAQQAGSGDIAVLKDDQRYIYYLVTKPQSWGKPTYESVQASLEQMREHMVNTCLIHIFYEWNVSLLLFIIYIKLRQVILIRATFYYSYISAKTT